MEFHFNTNRAEAERWLSTAVKLLTTRDLHGTKSFAIRARESDPRLEATEQIIAVADTLLAGDSQINNHSQQPDWYAVLQLAQYTQNLELVATQYRRLALLLNPHQNRFPYADHAFRLVSEAWNVLSNPSKKAFYDNELSMSYRFDPAPSGSTQLYERQFLQMHVQQQQPPQTPQPSPQVLQFQPQPAPPPPPVEVQRPQPQWHLQPQRQPILQPQPQRPQPIPQTQPLPQTQTQAQTQAQPPPPPHPHPHPHPQSQQKPQYQQPAQQQQPVGINPRSKDGGVGEVSIEEERPILNNVSHVTESTSPPSEPSPPAESAPPTDSAPQTPTRRQLEAESGSFWTACPYCFNLFEYRSGYEDCMLRCQNCRRAFNAVVIESPPMAGNGGEVNFCCWGYFPLGLTENGKDTGGSSEWTPFSAMFTCPIQGKKKNAERAKTANSGPRIYYDDEEALLDISDPSEDSDDDWQKGSIRRKKRALKAKVKASTAKPPVRASDRIRKGNQSVAGQGKVGSGGSLEGGSVLKAEPSKKSSSTSRKRGAAALGKLDLNVEFSNNEVEEPAAQTMSEGNGTANGEEDNIEGIGFFEGLDEFLSSLPILNAVGDDKVKAN